MRTFSLAVIALSACLVASSCASEDSGAGSSRSTEDSDYSQSLASPTTIRFALIPSSSTQFQQAIGTHFDIWSKIDPDLNVEVVSGADATKMMQSLAAGDVDIAQGAPSAFLSGIYRGLELTAVGSVACSADLVAPDGEHGKNALIVPVDSPIEDLEDLKGKKVGVTVGTGAQASMLAIFNEAGVPDDSYTTINVGMSDIASAFAAGGVDAIYGWEPNITTLLERGTARSIYRGTDYGDCSYLYVRNDFLQENPAAVRLFVLGQAYNDYWVTKNPAEASLIATNADSIGVELEPETFLKAWYGNLLYDPDFSSSVIQERYIPAGVATLKFQQSIGQLPDSMTESEMKELVESNVDGAIWGIVAESNWWTDVTDSGQAMKEKYWETMPLDEASQELATLEWPIEPQFDELPSGE